MTKKGRPEGLSKNSECQVHVYCSEELRDMLYQLAEKNHRSLSAQIKFLVETAFAKEFT
jgi:hypothetical protein